MTWAEDKGFAIDAAVNERMGFIRRTYLHLLGEIGAVGLVTWITLQTPALSRIAVGLLSNMLFYFAAFFGVALVSRKLMAGERSAATQYVGAGLWVVLLGLLVAPLAMIVHAKTGSYDILGRGFLLTGCVFGGLSAYVFTTKKDFSFLGGALSMASLLLLGVAVISVFLGWGGGSPVWSILWVVLLGGWVLYDTSQVLHHRRVGQHVAASVDLLVDFVYLFIHIVLLLMRSRD
jgi:FtsH-binding integral membrane protein